MKKLIFALLLSFGFVGLASASGNPPAPYNGYAHSANFPCGGSYEGSGSVNVYYNGSLDFFNGSMIHDITGQSMHFDGCDWNNDGTNIFGGSRGLDLAHIQAGVASTDVTVDYGSSVILHAWTAPKQNPFNLSGTVIGNVIATILSWMGALVGALVLISSTKWGIRWIKKAFPNAY